MQNESPYFRLYKRQPNYDILHTFGGVCYVHLLPSERTKLTPQSVECVFLGYAMGQKGYRYYDPKLKKIRVSRNVLFCESVFYYHHCTTLSPNVSASVLHLFQPLNDLQFPSTSSNRFKPGFVYTRQRKNGPATMLQSENNPQNLTLCPQPSVECDPEEDPELMSRSVHGIEVEDDQCDAPETDQCVATESDLNGSHVQDLSDHGLNPSLNRSWVRRSTRQVQVPDRYGFLATIPMNSIPGSFREAVAQECWKSAMKEELDALHKNETWDLVPCPDNVKPIGCKWVYTIKLKPDGTLDRYKACLVALGYSQEYGIDYFQTFAQVAKMTTV